MKKSAAAPVGDKVSEGRTKDTGTCDANSPQIMARSKAAADAGEAVVPWRERTQQTVILRTFV
jgi:hypothetical protein